ncbi:SusE domain-containing protein [Lutibacter sp. B1]|uniref:SusE domain-containing protein n=1 Tax=Lutibacter sp. B1 TaxID=2725996 RepID=UPI001456A9BC|nr:SusE domain-containing protein [Lutibacter sp. B1]NLP56834.1 hypothetical protein [Lutibacter sp. B1]
MKKLIYILIVIMSVSFGACSPDDVSINTLEESEAELIASELNTPDVSTFEIIQTTDAVQGNEAEEAVTFSWTAASGDNDGNIMYYLQMDVTGNDFESAVTIPLAQDGTSELSRSLTYGELNDAFNKIKTNLTAIGSSLSISFDEVNNFEVRVESVLGASIAKAYSQPITISSNAFYNGMSQELLIGGEALSENTTLINTDGVFATRVKLTSGTFRFFAVPTDSNISYNYDYFASKGYTIDSLLENANDDAMNFMFTGGEGTWDLTLNTIDKTITLEEVIGPLPTTWGVVGSGYNNWGAYADAPFYTTSQLNVYVAYATLVDGEIKFREDNAWDHNLGDTGADGTLEDGGDNIMVTAGTYKITMNLNDSTYTIEPFSWGIVGSGYNNWGETPDAKFYYDYTTDTFKAGVHLVDGEIKFRQNNAWDINYGDTGADGTLEDGGDNIVVTEGYYTVTLDFNSNTYTIEPDDLLGIVGSGYNNWGETPDFTLTEVNPDIWVGEIVTLLDGEIKFRVNSAWDTNYGDTGADGTLDNGGDNIVVTAGDYRVMLNLATGTYSIN